MSTDDFYESFKIINNCIGKYALVNTNEFIRLQKINGEYKWLPFDINNLPAIPIEMDSLNEIGIQKKQYTQIIVKPTWSFITNKKPIITQNIERIIFIKNDENNECHIFNKVYTNSNFLTTCNWAKAANDNILVNSKHAIEWKKTFKGLLFGFNEKEKLEYYINDYSKELEEFNRIYEESENNAKAFNAFQKKYIK